ncbi:MAG: hypothetical protein O3C22_01325 [Bacteroidetes bacterium]|nr:hypothetical protein [Bacteroidota bacterium]MDA0943987.1 hypothetical protein [Bacteroidota bacterium]MDA1112221.1 hypothetical protein [Bacteroidota bacterium]
MIEAIKYSIAAILLAFLQAYLIQEINMGVWHKPLPYVAIFFVLNVHSNRYAVLVAAFAFGFLIDLLSGSFGMHTGACVALAFFKNLYDRNWLDIDSITLQGQQHFSPEAKSWPAYLQYIGSLTFVHHLVFFSLDYFKADALLYILLTATISTMGTIGISLLLRELFSSK